MTDETDDDVPGRREGPIEPTPYVTDAELIRRLGVPEKIARDAIKTLDLNDGRQSGFPQKSKFWGNRRYWPAVKLWLDRHNGVIVDALAQRRAG